MPHNPKSQGHGDGGYVAFKLPKLGSGLITVCCQIFVYGHGGDGVHTVVLVNAKRDTSIKDLSEMIADIAANGKPRDPCFFVEQSNTEILNDDMQLNMLVDHPAQKLVEMTAFFFAA